jgi:hypothetical protein
MATTLVLLGPDVLGEDDAIFPLSVPAIVSVPAGFLCAYLGALAGRGRERATAMPYASSSSARSPRPGRASPGMASPPRALGGASARLRPRRRNRTQRAHRCTSASSAA